MRLHRTETSKLYLQIRRQARRKARQKSTIPQAVALGGNKLDCYGHNLVDIYSKYGFEPVARVAFNPEYANDGWTADKGSPDIYFMMHNGDSADAVVQNMNKYKRWSKAELDALPLMDYDSAYQYRDFLLNKSIQRKTENDMGAMRSQFESVPKQSQTQSNTIGSMEADWNVPESQRTPIMYDTISEAKSLDTPGCGWRRITPGKWPNCAGSIIGAVKRSTWA